VRSVQFKEKLFVFDQVVGLLLFQVVSCGLDDLGQFLGRELTQWLVFQHRAHLNFCGIELMKILTDFCYEQYKITY
jgi:hypothetical protein